MNDHDPVVRPVPDPTTLTTAALARDIATLREVIELQITGLSSKIEQRFIDNDKANDLAQSSLDRRQPEVDRRIESLHLLVQESLKLLEEKFAGVEKQFVERDVRVIQSATAATTAVNAALQAQKEAAFEQAKSFSLSIDKSEAATAKQIDALRDGQQTEIRALSASLSDLKERLTRIESLGIGSANAHQETHSSNVLVVAIVSGVVALFGVLIGATSIILRLSGH